MFWAEKLIANLDKEQPHIINDSKTPSGRAHVGALRGVLIHDAMFRLLREKGFQVRYIYGVDDYDPLDELPYGKDQDFIAYLGKPLCQVPPPPGTDASDMADYYISEFFQVFKYLNVEAETYRLREIYQSGQFDEAIDAILRNAPSVREVYQKVSGAQRPDHWYPFQAICENCGRIGTTEVIDYDGKEVTYHCRPDLVKWAQGCGYQGKVSPFSGKGKLPWKLEWVAKWATMGITVEGAGKDHTTKGGSRDVATHCLKEIFGKASPLNIPYEFFLVEGAKMSSSRGIGVAAKEMADFLPPEILRFLMLRPQPHKPINFSPDEKSITKLFNEFDRCHQQVFADTPTNEETKTVYFLSETQQEGDYYTANIQLLQALVQMPHIDVIEEIRKRKIGELTAIDIRHLQQRISSVKYWLAHLATEAEKLELQPNLPAEVENLTATQRAFLNYLAEGLQTVEWQGDSLQSKIFDIARLTPIRQPAAFQAIYQAIFARDLGPRAGNLFEFLERSFLIQRFKQSHYAKVQFWLETAMEATQLEVLLMEQQQKIRQAWVVSEVAEVDLPQSVLEHFSISVQGGQLLGCLQLYLQLTDDKIYAHRVLLHAEDNPITQEALQTHLQNYAKQLEQQANFSFTPLTQISQIIRGELS